MQLPLTQQSTDQPMIYHFVGLHFLSWRLIRGVNRQRLGRVVEMFHYAVQACGKANAVP